MNDPIGDLRGYLDRSPSPWHVVETTHDRLLAAGFQPVGVGARQLPPKGMISRDGALVAWSQPAAATPSQPFRIIGAHTDSPGLRVKPHPDTGGAGFRQLSVEVYGGALLNSWLDRDLGLAGRVIGPDGCATLVVANDALCRVPQLAIHLDRDVNERGLVLDKQAHLTPVWGTGSVRDGDFVRWLATTIGTPSAEIAAFELCLFDITPAAELGSDHSLLASGRLDNQLSCWAAAHAIAAAQPSNATAVIALFDHEEVGSESSTGAAGPLLERTLEQIVASRGGSRVDLIEALARSVCVSSDNAHALHPNYPERHEPGHAPIVDRGPALKVNSNRRYATSARGAALVTTVFGEAGVPLQTFVSRNNMPCGSTIGPITSTRLGIETVDIGVPQLSMHSARELCGTHDPGWLAAGLTALLDTDRGLDAADPG